MGEKDTTHRRSVLKAVGGSSVALSGLSNASIVAGAISGEDTVEITVVEGSDGPRLTKQVNKEWYEYEEHVERVANDARAEYFSNPAFRGIGVGAGEATVGGRPAGHLRFYTRKDSNVTVPSEYQGIPVERVERGEPEQLSCKCNSGAADYIYGGVPFYCNDTGAVGSVGCKVHRGGNQYLLTCAHLSDMCNRDVYGDVYEKGGERVGSVPSSSSSVTYGDPVEDWLLIEEDSQTDVYGYENYIKDYSGKLSGHVTKDGLKDFMCSSNKTVYKQGWKTCKRQGCLKDRDKTMKNCGSEASGGIEVSMFGEKGDSGGIFFKQYKFSGCYYTAPIGIISHGANNRDSQCDGDSFATDRITGISAYHLNNSYDIYFDPDFTQGC